MTARATLTVLRSGLLTTVQDLGRWGQQANGVPVAGPMDLLAHRLANACVGNAAMAATLEVTLLGPELRADADLVVAVAGAEFELFVDGVPAAPGVPVMLGAGQRLRFGARHRGARAYVAVAGGIATVPVLGSRATHLVSHMGGVAGRAVAAGDVLPIAPPAAAVPRAGSRPAPTWLPAQQATLRVMLGPQDAWFSTETLAAFLEQDFTVSTQSNRMGYRLEGPAIVASRTTELLSEPVPFGAIQVPAGGAPILLMADRQTAGGYPKIGTVITADLPVAGQLAPGDRLRFQTCTRAAALAALIAREREVMRVGARIDR
jgi:antagonist of KipI